MDDEAEPGIDSDTIDGSEMTHNQHLAEAEKKFVCDLCYRAFAVKKYLKRHLRTHAPKGSQFACDVCSKEYSRKDALKRHLLIHTELRPHECYMCNEAFSRKDELTKHFRIHKTVGNLYTCYKCYKAFAREDSLKRHLLVHSGEKSHLCPECGKSFCRKDELVKHFNIHNYPNESEEQQPSDEITCADNLKTLLIINIKRRKPLKVADQPVEIKQEPPDDYD